MASNNQSPLSSNSPGRVLFLDGQNELPMLEITTPWSTAEIYLHGAHVTHFQKHQEAPLLFMSQCSRFVHDKPIRGGIPIIFPWFGPREGLGQHGFARHQAWELKEVAPAADGSVSVRFHLPGSPEASAFPPCSVEYTVTVRDTLTACLVVKNESVEDVFELETCLHTYFAIGDVNTVSVRGLKGISYLDHVHKFARATEAEDAIRITAEVDRTYFDTADTVEILDPTLKRKITVEKEGSDSTVVWNPWIAKSQQMPDFGNDEYRQMVCVESGNVEANRLSLKPGEITTLTVKLSSSPLS